MRSVVRLLALTLGLLLVAQSAAAQADDVVLRFIDVGQGDAILVTSSGKAALIDTGGHDSIVGKLQALGVSSLDLLLITHNHADHFGGADAILSNLPVRFFLDNEQPAKNKTEETILALVDAKKIPYLKPDAKTLTVGDATLRLLPPPEHLRNSNQNDASVGVVLERGRFKALLSGDAEALELSSWLAADIVPQVDVLKAAHHGSRNGLTPLWLYRTKPAVVVISVGKDNDYGHPHPAALRYYEASGRRVFRTDLDGDVTVTIHVDGSYSIVTGNGATFAPEVVKMASPVEAPVDPR
jgi:competence protein ComEC